MAISPQESQSAAMPSEKACAGASLLGRVWAGMKRGMGDQPVPPGRGAKLWWLRLLVALGLAALLIPIGRTDGRIGRAHQAAVGRPIRPCHGRIRCADRPVRGCEEGKVSARRVATGDIRGISCD